jgi:hypothetical protein
MPQQVHFPCHFYLFPGKLHFREIAIFFSLQKFSREFTLSLYFPANGRKPMERLFFNRDTKENF